MRRDRRREIRLSSDEEQRWLTAARSLDLDFSSFVRQTVNSSLRAASVTHPPTPVPPSHWPVGEGVEVEDRETVLVGTAVERPPVPGRPEEGESGLTRVQPQDPPGGLSTVEVTSVGEVSPASSTPPVTADPDDAASPAHAPEVLDRQQAHEPLAAGRETERGADGARASAAVETAPLIPSACRNAAFHLIGKYCRFCGTVPQ